MKKSLIFAAIAAIACLVSCKKPEPIIPAEVSVSPSSVTFEAEGGTLNVVVTTNKDSYSVSGAPSWLTVAQNGNELALTAAQNTVTEELSATLTIKSEEASCTLEVKQKAGSPYPGYTVTKTAEFEYGGTMLYQFLKPQDGYDGGQGYIILTDEDGNNLTMWIYTDLFESEEEVTLTTGTYTKGEDTMGEKMPILYAKKLTFMAGAAIESSDDDDAYIYGSYYEDAAAGVQVEIVDGTVEVTKAEDGSYVIKAQVKDKNGKEYKLVNIGEVTIDTEGAGYPGAGGHMEMITEVSGASCYYMGDVDGKTCFRVMVDSGDEDNPVSSTFEFLVDAAEYDENRDLSGMYIYSAPSEGDEELQSEDDDEEDGDDDITGTLVPGSMVELFPGFEMPAGTYTMFGFGDYVLGNAYASLSLEKQEDGSYILMGSIMDSEGNFVMYMNVAVAIPVYDGTAEDEDE